MKENELSHQIIGAAIEVHKELGGPGLLESIYEEALVAELSLREIPCARQVHVPVFYKGRKLEKSLRLDLLVDQIVIVEVKAVVEFNAIHLSQCLTGLGINFGETCVKDGIHRVVNGL